jgi:hypothetical protein
VTDFYRHSLQIRLGSKLIAIAAPFFNAWQSLLRRQKWSNASLEKRLHLVDTIDRGSAGILV